tara:strand:- start:321 stop:569 length:249 start_codon:yes stop_codon:yes gene_type:complete
MSSVVRAKLVVKEVTHLLDGEGKPEHEQVSLSAVFSNDESDINYQWSKWTPSAEFNISITNPNAMNKLRSGKQYFVDLTPVD